MNLEVLVDVTTHLNPLKGPSQVVTNEFMCPFQAKLYVWETPMTRNIVLYVPLRKVAPEVTVMT